MRLILVALFDAVSTYFKRKSDFQIATLPLRSPLRSDLFRTKGQRLRFVAWLKHFLRLASSLLNPDYTLLSALKRGSLRGSLQNDPPPSSKCRLTAGLNVPQGLFFYPRQYPYLGLVLVTLRRSLASSRLRCLFSLFFLSLTPPASTSFCLNL